MEGYGFVALEGYPGNLTRTEQGIVVAWFKSSEAVRFDPWFEPLTNGRHRIWATTPHFGEALIPICGDALGYANPSDAEVLGEGWPALFATNVAQLEDLHWLDKDDPLNAAFRASLVAAAAGNFPSDCEP